MIRLGDCRSDKLVEHLFGSVTEFARLVEEKGNEFVHGGGENSVAIRVMYDQEKDRHTFNEILGA